MKKIFLTSGVVLCLACPAFAADTKDLVPQQNGGYLLAGTQNEPNCSTPDTLKSADGPTTFYAKWAPRTDLTVTYKPGTVGSTTVMAGSSEAADQVTSATFDALYTVYTNDSLEEMDLTGGGKGTVLTKKGYEFKGWKPEYNLANGQQAASNLIYAADENLEIEHYSVANPTNVDLTAQWSPLKYDIVYHRGANGSMGMLGTDPDQPRLERKYENAITFDEKYEAKTAEYVGLTANDGYTFRGWSLDEDSVYDPNGNNTWVWEGVEFNDDTEEDDLNYYTVHDYNVYAIYSANGYTLTYNCGQFSNDKKAKIGNTSNQTSSSQYTFAETSVTGVGTPSEYCKLLGYHVTSDAWVCHKTDDTNTTYTYAQVVNSTGNGKWNIANNVTCEVSGWTPNIIGLGWDAGTGATPNENAGADQCTYDLGIDVAGAPTKPGYNFVGWTTDPNYTSQSGYVIFKTSPDVATGTTVTSEGTSGTSQSLVEEEEEGE